MSDEQDKADLSAALMLDVSFKADVYDALFKGAGYEYMLAQMAEQVSDTPKELLASLESQINEALTEKNQMYEDIMEFARSGGISGEASTAKASSSHKHSRKKKQAEISEYDEQHLDDSSDEFVVPEDASESPEAVSEIPLAEEDEKDKDSSKLVAIEFDTAKYWKAIPQSQKESITAFIKSMAASKLTKNEVEVLSILASGTVHSIEDVVEASNVPIRARIAIDGLVEKGIAHMAGNLKNDVYLTQAGAWLYATVEKKNPMIFWDNDKKQSSFNF